MTSPSRPGPRLADAALKARLLSAAVLLPAALAILYLGGLWLAALVLLCGGLMAAEWSRMALAAPFASGSRRAAWLALGLPYVALPCVALLWIRADPHFGRATALWLLALTVAADCGAYLAGRCLGGPRLAPRISPGKTWAGLFGAIAAGMAVGLVTALALDLASLWSIMILSGLLAIVEQGGDLLESAFKRRFGVKDSGRIIPGHGGVLDRVDGLMAVGTVVALLNLLGGRSVLAWP